MANANAPFGFRPVGHLTGGEIRTRRYIVTASQTIYKGDPVVATSNGTITVASADAGLICLGIAADSVVTSATGATLDVYDDPNIVFEVQSTTAAVTDVFGSADHVAGSANTTLKTSGAYLDTIGTGALQFLVIGISDKGSNAAGQYSVVNVVFNEHFFKAAVAGV